MREHVRILGILNIVMGCLTALVGIVVLIVMGGLAGVLARSLRDSDIDNGALAAPILATIGICVAVFFLALALPCILGGWGLMNFKPWARVLMIVVSIFHLLHIPLGTALGVYGLWVLFSDEARHLFESGGRAYFPPVAPYPASMTPPRPAAYPPQAPPGQ